MGERVTMFPSLTVLTVTTSCNKNGEGGLITRGAYNRKCFYAT